MSNFGRRCSFLALAIWTLAAPLQAQEGGEHAAHHGGEATASAMNSGDGAMGTPQPATSGMSSMMEGMMKGMMGGEGEHGEHKRRSPFFPQLLTSPELSPEQRRAVAAQAGERIEEGMAMIGAATAAGMHAPTAAARLEAARTLREGVDLFQSGAAAQAALETETPPSEIALPWFRRQLGIEQTSSDTGLRWFGTSASHLLFMVFLAAVSATLIGLQIFRLRRIRKIVGSVKPAGQGSAEALAPPMPAAPPPARNAAPSMASGDRPISAAAASLRKPERWSGQLRVAQIVRETPTVLTFRLTDPGADRLPFDFLPGQFLQVEVNPQGEKAARRSYTIASSPTQRAYVELTVKREEQGVVSRYFHDHIAVGDLLKITGPFGDFTFTGTDADSIVLIAGGVGITPMMSVLRYLTDTAWAGQIFFLYGARSTEEFVFREELERLERRFANLHVMAAMQRSAGTVWLGPEGPITKEMLRSAVPDVAKRRVHLCGPPGMMAAMRDLLAELGVPDAQLHTEAFGPASLPADPGEVEIKDAPPAPRRGDFASSDAAVAPATITFSISGVSASLPADRTVLEAAEEAGVEIPFACRSGECGICVTKLLAGEVSMGVETGLAPADKDKGYILACQAKSTGQPLVVEA